MALTKLQAEGLNLADTFAFTGTVSGAGGGKLLQVKNYTNDYAHNTTGTSATDVLSSSGVTWEPAITPTVATSTLIVLSSININNADNSATSIQEQRYFLHCDVKVGSGSYSSFIDQNYLGQYYYNSATRPQPMDRSQFVVQSKEYDHNTTDEIKFRWQFGLHSSGVKIQLGGNGIASTVTLMEIA
tara:strand:+ start:57 stop:614 length:558 start_codon:yes stop_codon:yes gene_type:complete